MKRFYTIVLIFLAIVCPHALYAASPVTGIDGCVVDAQNGDTIPFAQILFEGSTIGTTSDLDGRFSLSNTEGLVTLRVQMVGYKTLLVTLRPGKVQHNQTLKLEPDVYGLGEILVTPKTAKKERYKRKGNPAVELIKNVIAHKKDNRLESLPNYKVNSYEKRILALDQFDFDFNRNKFWKNFDFIENYVDTAQFNRTPVLTVSVHETMEERYYQQHPKKERTIVTAERAQGIEQMLNESGLGQNLDAMFTGVDLTEDNVELMLNRFVSPLSSTMAVSFYHYFIQDTVVVEGDSCIDLAFVPVNSESFGFTGHLYILYDSTYAVRKYTINVPPHINLNFVSDLSLEQTYRLLDNGYWAPEESNTYARFYIFKKLRHIYGHHRTRYDDYAFGVQIPDSLFPPMSDKELVLDSARRYSPEAWNEMRPVPLTAKEAVIDSLLIELKRVPQFQGIVKTCEILGAEYIATNSDRNLSKWDFGPIWNFVSYNQLEGLRLRIGGMTTANLSQHWFLQGYVAFGCTDLRPKHNVTGIYSFTPKEYHPYESLRHALYLSSQYDVEVPGQTYALFDRDNILMSIPTGTVPTAMQYVYTAKLRYEKEWANRFSVNTWFQYQNNEAAGSLSYDRYRSDGTIEHVNRFHDFSLGLQLRYAPGEPYYNNRLGHESPFNLSKDAPVLKLTHVIGVMEMNRLYNTTTFSAEKRFWFGSFGHLDAMLQAGIMWNKVPFPKLYIPNSNQSLFMTPNTFNLMKPMEFAMDQYIMLHATYYMKGLILNHIPYLNRLKLREVISFSGIYGGLSAKNNPAIQPNGLYVLPEGCSPIGKVPYMELTVGIENIFKILRIDYVRRLNYLDGLTGWQRNGIRFTFRLAM